MICTLSANGVSPSAVPSALTVPLVERGEMDWTLSPSPSTLISTSLPAGKLSLLFTLTVRAVPSVHMTETACCTSALFVSTRVRDEDWTTPENTASAASPVRTETAASFMPSSRVTTWPTPPPDREDSW